MVCDERVMLDKRRQLRHEIPLHNIELTVKKQLQTAVLTGW